MDVRFQSSCPQSALPLGALCTFFSILRFMSGFCCIPSTLLAIESVLEFLVDICDFDQSEISSTTEIRHKNSIWKTKITTVPGHIENGANKVHSLGRLSLD